MLIICLNHVKLSDIRGEEFWLRAANRTRRALSARRGICNVSQPFMLFQHKTSRLSLNYRVLYKLWESSWRTDAVVLDRERDLYADPTLFRKINHSGKYYKTEGPNLVKPSPQGSPLIYQAGTSTAGVEFAGKHAEAVFV